jgi:hypothetical protein
MVPTHVITEFYMPKVAAALSMFASSVIICEVYQDFTADTATAVSRILLSMSIGDLLFSLGWILGTWAVPKDLPDNSFSCTNGTQELPYLDGTNHVTNWTRDSLIYLNGTNLGTRGTCPFQGFIIQMGLMASLLFSASLAVVYLLQTTYQWRPERLLAGVQLNVTIGVLWTVCLISAVIPLCLDMYRWAGPLCWISAPATGEVDTIECQEGPATTLVFSLHVIPVWSCIILDSIIMAVIYRKVRLVDQKAQQPHRSRSRPMGAACGRDIVNRACKPMQIDRIRFDAPPSRPVQLVNKESVYATEAKMDEMTIKPISHMIGRSVPDADGSSGSEALPFSVCSAMTAHPILFPLQLEAGGDDLPSNRSMLYTSTESGTHGKDDIVLGKQTGYDSEEEKLEECSTRSCRLVSDVCDVTNVMDSQYQQHGRPFDDIPAPNRAGITPGDPEEVDGEMTAPEERHTPWLDREGRRSRIVATQGMCYIGGFLITYGLASMCVVFVLIDKKWQPQLDRASYFFLALQGLWNFLVFSRGRTTMKTQLGAKLKKCIWDTPWCCYWLCPCICVCRRPSSPASSMVEDNVQELDHQPEVTTDENRGTRSHGGILRSLLSSFVIAVKESMVGEQGAKDISRCSSDDTRSSCSSRRDSSPQYEEKQPIDQSASNRPTRPTWSVPDGDSSSGSRVLEHSAYEV